MGEGGAGGEVRAPELTIVNQKKRTKKKRKNFFHKLLHDKWQ